DSNVNDVNNFTVMVNVTNTGDESLKLYKDPRGTLSSFPENTFSISSVDGEDHPEFVGASVKYGFDTATEFVTLEPGSSFIANHDCMSLSSYLAQFAHTPLVSEAYKFSKGGDYKIEATNLFFYKDASDSPVSISASVSAPHQAKLSGNLVSRALVKRSLEYASKSEEMKQLVHRDTESGALHRRVQYDTCSPSQQSMIDETLPYVIPYLDDSISWLYAVVSSGDTRYETWFGEYALARQTIVYDHFTAIRQDDVTTYRYVCDCSRDVYGASSISYKSTSILLLTVMIAYVYRNEPKIVYLCTVFWSAPTTGKDSKAGTIIHEASHFTINGGTEDFVYGQTLAMLLAQSNPDNAIMNADNHEDDPVVRRWVPYRQKWTGEIISLDKNEKEGNSSRVPEQRKADWDL
ncbi:10492_t:CDS:2, partial [Acaulospora colombiana]